MPMCLKCIDPAVIKVQGHISMLTTQPSNIETSGFIEVFGISVESRGLKTSTKTELELMEKCLGSSEAHLLISGIYISSKYNQRKLIS